MKIIMSFFLSIALSSVCLAQQPTTLEGPNGTQFVIAGDAGARAFHEKWHYAPAVRAGDNIYLSGLIAGPAANDGTDAGAYERGLHRAFKRIGEHLAILGASFDDVIKITTYHVFKSEYFDGDKLAHLETVAKVKDVYIKSGPYPAWTAIGVAQLFADSGLVEIEITAYAPQSTKSTTSLPKCVP